MFGDGRAKFLKALTDNQQAIRVCLEAQLWLPTLVLVYALIDAMAWLARDASHEDVTRSDFVAWCERYLVLQPTAALSGLDLYAARCGILHSHIAESKLMRDGDARPLWYELPTGATLVPLQTSSKLIATTVRLRPLVTLLFDRAEAFVRDVDADAGLAKLVWDRADRYYDTGVMQPPPARGA